MRRFLPRGILPPYILDRVAADGGADAAEPAEVTRRITSRLRASRLAAVADPSSVPPCPDKDYIHDAGGREVLPGAPIQHGAKAPLADTHAKEAHDGVLETRALLWTAFRRRSLDGKGGALRSTVHFGRRYSNAFWDGQQMAYGDGDGALFNRFTSAVDVIGHELAHGVTQYTSNLEYYGQPGALNEHFSDVIGSLVKQRALKQRAEDADWLIGAGLFTGRVKGKALRSMAAPGTAYDDAVLGRDPQPATMAGFYDGPEDEGGVHINSGIPNKVFWRVATGLRGFAWELPGRIWWRAFTQTLGPKSTFSDAAAATIMAARAVKDGSAEAENIVRAAWAEAGVSTTSPAPR